MTSSDDKLSRRYRDLPRERFEPANADRWDSQYRRFQEYLELTCV